VRVAQLTATFPPYWGGTGTAAFEVSRRLAERGHDLHVFTGTADPDGANDPAGVNVHRLKPALSIGNAPLIPRLGRLLRDFDVVHFQHPFIFGTEPALLTRLRRAGPALVVTYQNRLLGERLRRPLFWAYEETSVRALLHVADRVCMLSRAHGESVTHLRAGMRRDPERFVEVPNGVDVDHFTPGAAGDVRDELGIPADAPVAIQIAALDRAHHFKRTDLCIEATARLADVGVHLIVVGGGELLDDYRSLAGRLGVADRVHFAGRRPNAELPRWLRAADVSLLPSDPPESFGIVLVEGMACGLPAVAADYPGARAVVAPGAGRIVPRGDAGALAESVRELVTLPAAEREAGVRATLAQAHAHSWPAIAERLEMVYTEAIARRRKIAQP
jgi:glycosyltransferase involved in cell wall biosynthesis